MTTLCAFCSHTPEKNLKCSRCRSAYYCNVQCQRAHWSAHQRYCHPCSSQEHPLKETFAIFNHMLHNADFVELLNTANLMMQMESGEIALGFASDDRGPTSISRDDYPAVTLDTTVNPVQMSLVSFKDISSAEIHELVTAMYDRGNFPVVIRKRDIDGAISKHVLEHYNPSK